MNKFILLLLCLFPMLLKGEISHLSQENTPQENPLITFLVDGKPSTTCNCDTDFKSLSIVVPIGELDAFEWITIQLKNEEGFRPLARIKADELQGKKEIVLKVINDEKSDFYLQLTEKYHFLKKNDLCYNKKGEALTINAEARGHVLLSHQIGKPPIFDKGELLAQAPGFILKRSPNFEQPEHDVATYAKKDARKVKAKKKRTGKKIFKFMLKNIYLIGLGIALIIGVIAGDFSS